MSTINKPQNPVAWVTSEPQKREWVELTDEEIEKCIALVNPIAICEEVEAKLKAKNT